MKKVLPENSPMDTPEAGNSSSRKGPDDLSGQKERYESSVRNEQEDGTCHHEEGSLTCKSLDDFSSQEMSRESSRRNEEGTSVHIFEVNVSQVSLGEESSSLCISHDESSGQEMSRESLTRKEQEEGTSLQACVSGSSQFSMGEMFHCGGEQIGNIPEKDDEKWKGECAQEQKVPEPSCVDKINSSKENISDKVILNYSGLEHAQNGNELIKSGEATEIKLNEMSATLKEQSVSEKSAEKRSFQEAVNEYGVTMRFSTRIKKNAPMPLAEGFAVFRRGPKDAEFLSYLSPSEFCLTPEIRLYRHRSILRPSSSLKKAIVTKTKAEYTSPVQGNESSLKRESCPSLIVQPSENTEAREKSATLQPPRNVKSIKRAKEILLNQKTNVIVQRRSLRQKLGTGNAKKKEEGKMKSLYATRQSGLKKQESSKQNKLIGERGKPDNGRKCCESSGGVKEKEIKLPQTDYRYKHLSSSTLKHLQKLWNQRKCPTRRTSKFTRKKREYLSKMKVHKKEGYLRRFQFFGQSGWEKSTTNVLKRNLRETLLKRNEDPTAVSSNDSCDMEHFQTSFTGQSQIFREQNGEPAQLNLNGKGGSLIPQSRERQQDPDYEPHSYNASDSEESETSITTISASEGYSRVGSPEIEIDVDLSQTTEADQHDEVIPEAAENEGSLMENVQPRKLPIFRKLPNPSSEPVATFYYNPEATMLRRCSKYHSCCQMSAAAASVTKLDSCTQWEDPAMLYEVLNSKTGLHPQTQHHENSATLPSLSVVRKKMDLKYKMRSKLDLSSSHLPPILTDFQNIKERSKKKTDQLPAVPGRKSVVSNSKGQGSSELASSTAAPNVGTVSSPKATSASVPCYPHSYNLSTVNRETGKQQNIPLGCTNFYSSSPSVSGLTQLQVQDTSVSKINALIQACARSVSSSQTSAIEGQGHSNLATCTLLGRPVNSGTTLKSAKVSMADRPTSTAFAAVNSNTNTVKPMPTSVATSRVQTSQTAVIPPVQKSSAPPVRNDLNSRSHFLFKNGILWQQIFDKGVPMWSKIDRDLYNLVDTPSKACTRVELKSMKTQKAPDVIFEVPNGIL